MLHSRLMAAARTRPGRITLITAGLLAECLLVLWWQAPDQTFVRFAAMDSGGELAIQALIRQGMLPGVDFGYPYGLLALLVGRVWYGVAGLAPISYRILVLAASSASCWGIARLVADRRVGLTGLILIALAIPDLLFVTYLTSVQTIEQALLINALAEHARGRRGAALALLTACCFVKPSLAFVQGLVVLILTLAAVVRTNRATLIQTLVPSVVVAGLLALVLSLVFSPTALATTLSPARGASIYRANHYGFFFGQGRAFWILPGAGVRDYFRYEVGFWLLATGFLIWGTATSLIRLFRQRSAPGLVPTDELVVVCGLVHVAFVTLIFGHRWTWVYSLPMLILGLVLLAQQGRRSRVVVALLAGLLMISDRSKAVAVSQQWRVRAPSPVTLNLWATPEERAEWTRVLELTQGQRPVLFAMCEGGSVLISGFAPPVAGYLVPGNMLPAEVDRKASQLARARMIVSYHPPEPPDFEPWPQLHAAFKDCDLIYPGRTVQVYQRRIVGNPAQSVLDR